MKLITEDTPVAWVNGQEVTADHLQRWAYDQLESAIKLNKALDAISIQLGKAFTESLQGDDSFFHEMAQHNEIIFVDGEPRAKIAALDAARGDTPKIDRYAPADHKAFILRSLIEKSGKR